MSQLHDKDRSAYSNLSIDDSLEPWDMPVSEWLIRNQKRHQYDGVATGNIVFNSDGKVLMIQRASHDSLPNKWEFPGGAVDSEDPTILLGASRELREESGLIAKRFTHVITEGPDREPGEVFRNRTKTKVFIRFTFHVEVEDCEDVKLDPNEHQDFVWASEEEIRRQKIGDRQISVTRWTVQALFLEAFRLRKKRIGTL